jgi:hypothetical protein
LILKRTIAPKRHIDAAEHHRRTPRLERMPERGWIRAMAKGSLVIASQPILKFTLTAIIIRRIKIDGIKVTSSCHLDSFFIIEPRDFFLCNTAFFDLV